MFAVSFVFLRMVDIQNKGGVGVVYVGLLGVVAGLEIGRIEGFSVCDMGQWRRRLCLLWLAIETQIKSNGIEFGEWKGAVNSRAIFACLLHLLLLFLCGRIGIWNLITATSLARNVYLEVTCRCRGVVSGCLLITNPYNDQQQQQQQQQQQHLRVIGNRDEMGWLTFCDNTNIPIPGMT